jgi:hypothetical protein
MASLTRRASHALKLDRSCEVSRLEEQVLATVYELVTPLLRHPIPNTGTDRQPASRHAPPAGRPQRQAGGSHA